MEMLLRFVYITPVNEGYYVEIFEATKSCGYVMFWIFIRQLVPPLQ